ncbi:hypothetical protein D3C84_465250 [compost metagenome]
MESFSVDPDHFRSRFRRQPGQRHIVGDGIGVVAVHVLQHADLRLTGEGIGQHQLGDPVDGAEAADEARTDRFQAPEIEIVGAVVIHRLGEIAVVAGSGGFNLGFALYLPGLGQQSQAPRCLDVLGAALAHQQRTFRVLLQVMGVLGDTADQDQRPAFGIQAIGHH